MLTGKVQTISCLIFFFFFVLDLPYVCVCVCVWKERRRKTIRPMKNAAIARGFVSVLFSLHVSASLLHSECVVGFSAFQCWTQFCHLFLSLFSMSTLILVGICIPASVLFAGLKSSLNVVGNGFPSIFLSLSAYHYHPHYHHHRHHPLFYLDEREKTLSSLFISVDVI